MPSPFPGMDPFIEGQEWRDFHTLMISEIKRALVPELRPKYVATVEDYVYLVREIGEPSTIGPDVSIRPSGLDDGSTPARLSTPTLEPVIVSLPVPDEVEEHYLVIRSHRGGDVVTIVELLSPTNKSAGRGGDAYVSKRENVLLSRRTHLVEIDLLRGGRRMPTEDSLPPGEFYAFVCRTDRYREAEVHAWSLRERLPSVPIPLADGDPDVLLDLQSVFDAVYDGSGYDYVLDYDAEVTPPVDEETAGWIRDRLVDGN